MTKEWIVSTFSVDSIPKAFEQVASVHAKRTALVAEGGLGRKYTYFEILQTVRTLAGGLLQMPYSDQAEIGLLSENRPEWPIAYLGILAAGKTVVPIDASLKPFEIGYIVDHANLRLVFCSGQFEETLLSLNEPPEICSFEEGSDRAWTRLHVEKEDSPRTNTRETAVLIYTSGTTGAPKAVELTHRNLLSNVDGILFSVRVESCDVFASVLPLHHTFETTVGFLTPLLTGASIVYTRSLKSKEIVEDIRMNRATIMCGVPLLFEKMYESMNRKLHNAPFYRRALFHLLFAVSALGWRLGHKWGRALFRRLRENAGMISMRLFVSGGAALRPATQRFLNLIGFDFIQGYGLTETSPVLTAQRVDDIRYGSVGPPLKNVQLAISQPDESGTGEIVARGPGMTPGYRGNQEMTSELIKDGWLHTGDLGRLVDGHLWITGRAKNIIVSAAGKNIYPEEIEEKLTESQYILEALVFGRTKEGKQGEEVRALIVPNLDQIQLELHIDTTKPDLGKIAAALRLEVDDLNNRIAGYKRIVGFDIQLEELEKTATKKIKRFLYNRT